MFGLSGMGPAAVDAAVVVSERAETRVRDSNEPSGRAIDLETAPAVLVRVDDRRWRLDANYSPRFTTRSVGRDNEEHDTLQRAAVGASWHDRRVSISLREDASFGDQNFSSLSTPQGPVAATPPAVQLLPPSASIRYASTRATATLSITLSRRWSSTTSADYGASGGIDDPSRAVIPLQSGPRAEQQLFFQASRRDSIGAIIAASRVVFSSGPEADLQESSAVWRRSLTRTIDVGFRAGATVSGTRLTPLVPVTIIVWPVGEFTIRNHRVDRYSISLSVRASPVVDRLTGVIDERLQTNMSVRWMLTPRWVLRGDGGLATSLRSPANHAVTVLLSELVLGWKIRTNVVLEFGARTAWQRQEGFPLDRPQWVGFAAATFTTAPVSTTSPIAPSSSISLGTRVQP